ncbi:WecB/TagA/CpsF family glycosyltransferase [Vibrio cholerae]|uniref:WecB/TagA/CpsF family glycosyltransferase n=1 Tax=Vibrio cholerae TaxID=666 RepID=UPI000E0BAF67|nr:WecB/TagA/CpsF family glycosyltransferase [Vibrio cholerae]
MLDAKIKNREHFITVIKCFDYKKTISISFLNPFSYYQIKSNDDLKREIDFFYADGASLVLLHNIFNINKIDRVSFDFSSIAYDVLSTASSSKRSIIFVGGSIDEAVKAKKNLQSLFPDLILEVVDGFITSEDIMDKISNFDIVVFGMGCPLQDITAIKAKRKYPDGKIIFTCGGFITQTSIKPDYYNHLIKKLGLRWLQRIILHKHVRHRVIKYYPSFFVKYILGKI